ncbi:MAG TPA: hypothetical protein VKF40_25590 [Burkholderiales bacterium]|nr:hypothetical protein [Burkholderiales bacterium]
MAEYLKAWQCIGCGRLEGAQPCIGVCEDRRVDLVDAADYEEAVAATERTRAQVERFASLVRQLATTTPRNGEWERSYRELQRRARAALQS